MTASAFRMRVDLQSPGRISKDHSVQDDDIGPRFQWAPGTQEKPFYYCLMTKCALYTITVMRSLGLGVVDANGLAASLNLQFGHEAKL